MAQDSVEPESLEWGTDISKIDQSEGPFCAAFSIYERKIYPRPCNELNYSICTNGKTRALDIGGLRSWGDSFENCMTRGLSLAFPNAKQIVIVPRILLLREFAWINYKNFYDDRRHRDPADRRGEHWMSMPSTAIQNFASLPAAPGNCGALLATGPSSANCDTSMHEACVRDIGSGTREWNVTSTRIRYFETSKCAGLGSGFRRGVPANPAEIQYIMQMIATRNLAPAWLAVHTQNRARRCITPETFMLCSALLGGATIFWASQNLPGDDADKPPVVDMNISKDLPLPWYFDAIHLSRRLKVSSSIAVGVLDSGVDFSGLLSNAKSREFNYTSDPIGVSTSAAQAERIHGTLMASIIAGSYGTLEGKPVMGIAPNVKIVSRKITPNAVSRVPGERAISSAIADATAERPDQDWPPEPILNVSFASQGLTGVQLEDLRNRLIEVGKSNKTLIVAAVGNDGFDIDGLDISKWNWPAAYYPKKGIALATDPVIRVAALQKYAHGETPALYATSRRGAARVDIAAPGAGIAAVGPGGRYLETNGTSQATAIVSGVLALMKSCAPQATASELKSFLLSTSDRHAALAAHVKEGRVINADRAIAAACARTPDDLLYMK